jgi:uncharacterized protein YjbI with pentapeptide repeats
MANPEQRLNLLLQHLDLWNVWSLGEPLVSVDLSGPPLNGANLVGLNFIGANLSEANLSGANPVHALIVETRLEDAPLNDCHIYSVSAWRVKLSEGTKQQGLIITTL